MLLCPCALECTCVLGGHRPLRSLREAPKDSVSLPILLPQLRVLNDRFLSTQTPPLAGNTPFISRHPIQRRAVISCRDGGHWGTPANQY